MNKKIKLFLSVLIAVAVGLGALLSATAEMIPESLSVMESSEALSTAVNKALSISAVSASVNTKTDGATTATVKFLGLIPIKQISVNVLKETKLCPGGMAFGVKFFTKGVVIVGLSDVETHGGTLSPATEAGLKAGDVILSMNGKEVNTTDEVGKLIADCKGEGISVSFKRGEEEKSTTVYPAICAKENVYKAGVWVRDSTAGIGTVTYVNAKTGEFGGLGHGICDVDTGALLPLLKGVVVDVAITDVVKGLVSAPGELKGDFSSVKKGSLKENTGVGIFGTFDSLPKNLSEPLPIGLRDEVKEGKAFIYTTLSDNKIGKYEIEIEKIYKDSGQTKNFLIKVTDKNLLKQTGGLVQGMSGSPIVQNGKIIGAVTHVLVNDPTRGYGIFIENMLNAAE